MHRIRSVVLQEREWSHYEGHASQSVQSVIMTSIIAVCRIWSAALLETCPSYCAMVVSQSVRRRNLIQSAGHGAPHFYEGVGATVEGSSVSRRLS